MNGGPISTLEGGSHLYLENYTSGFMNSRWHALIVIAASLLCCSSSSKVEMSGIFLGCENVKNLSIKVSGGRISNYRKIHVDADSFKVSFDVSNTVMPEAIMVLDGERILKYYAIRTRLGDRKVKYFIVDKKGNLVSDTVTFLSPIIQIQNLRLNCN